MNRKFFPVILIVIVVILAASFIFIRMSVDSTKFRAKRKTRLNRSSYVQVDNITRKETISKRREFDVFKPEPKKVERDTEDEWSGLEFEDNKEEVFLR